MIRRALTVAAVVAVAISLAGCTAGLFKTQTENVLAIRLSQPAEKDPAPEPRKGLWDIVLELPSEIKTLVLGHSWEQLQRTARHNQLAHLTIPVPTGYGSKVTIKRTATGEATLEATVYGTANPPPQQE